MALAFFMACFFLGVNLLLYKNVSHAHSKQEPVVFLFLNIYYNLVPLYFTQYLRNSYGLNRRWHNCSSSSTCRVMDDK